MLFKCFAFGCDNTSLSEHVIFHRFPENGETAREWARLTRPPSITAEITTNQYDGHRLCSDHFLPSQYATNRLLHRNAMPTSLFHRIDQPKTPVESHCMPTDRVTELTRNNDTEETVLRSVSTGRGYLSNESPFNFLRYLHSNRNRHALETLILCKKNSFKKLSFNYES